MNLQNEDRKRLDCERSQAARYFAERYSREERYLRIFARDFSRYLSSADYLRSSESRKVQVYYDFLLDFERLKELMKEFRWSKEFLLGHGIDFVAVRKLYFSVQ